jgi:hypothetical protein
MAVESSEEMARTMALKAQSSLYSLKKQGAHIAMGARESLDTLDTKTIFTLNDALAHRRLTLSNI